MDKLDIDAGNTSSNSASGVTTMNEASCSSTANASGTNNNNSNTTNAVCINASTSADNSTSTMSSEQFALDQWDKTVHTSVSTGYDNNTTVQSTVDLGLTLPSTDSLGIGEGGGNRRGSMRLQSTRHGIVSNESVVVDHTVTKSINTSLESNTLDSNSSTSVNRMVELNNTTTTTTTPSTTAEEITVSIEQGQIIEGQEQGDDIVISDTSNNSIVVSSRIKLGNSRGGAHV